MIEYSCKYKIPHMITVVCIGIFSYTHSPFLQQMAGKLFKNCNLAHLAYIYTTESQHIIFQNTKYEHFTIIGESCNFLGDTIVSFNAWCLLFFAQSHENEEKICLFADRMSLLSPKLIILL